MSEVEFVEIMQEHSCEDTSPHIALEIKQKDALMGCPGDKLQNPDSRADGKAEEEWSENGQKKQGTYAAADQDMSELLKENSKLNINDENNSYNDVDVTYTDGEIAKNKSPTMKNGQKKQETYAVADQDMSEQLKENSKLNINDENSSHNNEDDVTYIDGEISKNKSPTMKNGQKKQETYAAADQDMLEDMSEQLKENSKLNINDENSSHNEDDVTYIDGEISKNKSPTMKNGQNKQETYAAADQDMSEQLKENSKLNINDENSSHNEDDVTYIDGEISKNKSPTMKNGQNKQETYAAADQDMSEQLKENSKLNINDENSSHNEDDVTCIDGEISKNKSPTMKNHITHNAIKPHMCQTCGEVFVLYETLKIHMDTHIDIERHECEACGEEFAKFDTLKRHVEAHAGIKKHKCMICSKAFTRPDLKKHMTTHTIETALKPHELMNLNEEEFVRSEKLESHVEAHTAPNTCGVCGKKTSTSYNLKLHMTTHTGRKKHLNNHMIAHTGLKEHKCMICSKVFTRSGHLKKHMTTHTIKTALKPHELMNLNEEEFVRSEKLESHVEAHAGIKKHKCGICGKKTSTAYNLKVHMTTHTGQHLNNHMIARTGLNEHKCMICSKAYGRSDHLKRHMKTHEL